MADMPRTTGSEKAARATAETTASKWRPPRFGAWLHVAYVGGLMIHVAWGALAFFIAVLTAVGDVFATNERLHVRDDLLTLAAVTWLIALAVLSVFWRRRSLLGLLAPAFWPLAGIWLALHSATFAAVLPPNGVSTISPESGLADRDLGSRATIVRGDAAPRSDSSIGDGVVSVRNGGSLDLAVREPKPVPTYPGTIDAPDGLAVRAGRPMPERQRARDAAATTNQEVSMASLASIAGLQTIADLGLPDQAIQSDEIPWVPQGEGVWFKPLRFDLANGRWVNLLKITKQGKVNRHRHSGGQVLGFVVQGGWRYLERDWVARPGTFIYEPPGDIHTLVNEGAEETLTLFLLEGVIQYLDDDDNVIYQDDVFTKMERYLNFCRDTGIEPVDLRF